MNLYLKFMGVKRLTKGLFYTVYSYNTIINYSGWFWYVELTSQIFYIFSPVSSIIYWEVTIEVYTDKTIYPLAWTAPCIILHPKPDKPEKLQVS